MLHLIRRTEECKIEAFSPMLLNLWSPPVDIFQVHLLLLQSIKLYIEHFARETIIVRHLQVLYFIKTIAIIYAFCVFNKDIPVAMQSYRSIINKQSELKLICHCLSACPFFPLPLVSSSENWCALKLKVSTWQVMV